MRFFLDTGNLVDLREAITWGTFSGVTMNPIIMARESSDYETYARTVLGLVPEDWEVSLEVQSGAADEMTDQGRTLASWDRRVRVKLPTTVEGLKAAALLLGEVRLNMTIVKSPAQAMMCLALMEHVKTGDMVVSVFCGRLRQAGHDWQIVVSTLAKMNSPVKVLAASIKTPADISDAVAAGADIITAPLDVYQITMSSPLVDEDVNAFDQPFKLNNLQIPGAVRRRVSKSAL